MNTLDIDAWYLTTDERMCTAVPVARVLARDTPHVFNQVLVLYTSLLARAIAQAGATDMT